MSTIGVALGAGGIRGLANIGVFSVFEENGIKPQIMVGSSMGGLLGALLAVGLTSQDVLKLALSIKPETWLDITLPKFGFSTTKRIHAVMELLTKHKKIEELPVKFATIGSDLLSGESIVVREGSIADAVCATVCIPGIFEPFRMGKYLFVDGAVTNPTPVDVVKSMGADVVIGIDFAELNLNAGPIDTIYEVIIHSLELMERNLHTYEGVEEKCDLLIRPQLPPKGVKSLTDFRDIKEAYEAGRKAALKALPEILETIRNSEIGIRNEERRKLPVGSRIKNENAAAFRSP